MLLPARSCSNTSSTLALFTLSVLFLSKIDNDSYLIIVYRDFEKILVSDYKVKDAEDTSKALDDASKNVKTSTGQKLLKLVGEHHSEISIGADFSVDSIP